MAEIGYAVNPEQDAAGHKGAFSVVEPGWKKVVIVGSEMKTTKDGAGKYLELKYELQDGTSRTLTDRLNILNKSEVAQRIGRGALGKIALACGVKGQLTDSNILHGRPFEVLVSVKEEPSKNNPAETFRSNEIGDYREARVLRNPTESTSPAAW